MSTNVNATTVVSMWSIRLVIKQRHCRVTVNMKLTRNIAQFLNQFFLAIDRQIFMYVRNHCIAQKSFES